MFDHEKLDVYRVSIEFVRWVHLSTQFLVGNHRNAKDQIQRASQSIPLNIAEGNGKLPSPDRQRFLRIALGSALECAATLDVLLACEGLESGKVQEGKIILKRIVSMLTKMAIEPTYIREGNTFEYE